METWENSAGNKLKNMASVASDILSFDESYLGYQRDRIARTIRHNGPNEEIFYSLHELGCEAMRALKETDQWNYEEMLKLLVRKQHDYGHENILAFGIIGVGIRACDKVARYFNLKDQPQAAQNEPFIDCMMDMVGYAVIGSMLKDNTFTLKLGCV